MIGSCAKRIDAQILTYRGKKMGWHVIRVDCGKEEEALFFMDKILNLKELGRPFIPKVVRKRKLKDGWHDRYLPFVPGYLFFETDEPTKLFFELKKVPKRTTILRIDDDMLAVSPDEEAFIRSFFGSEDTVEVSVIHKVGDKVVVDSGPLAGREAIIKKIWAHKRTALISTDMFGRTMELKVGIDFLSRE